MNGHQRGVPVRVSSFDRYAVGEQGEILGNLHDPGGRVSGVLHDTIRSDSERVARISFALCDFSLHSHAYCNIGFCGLTG
jgi:hypothetical protein